MVLDTSALVAILLGEPVAERLLAAIERSDSRMVSAATVVEVAMVLLGRFGPAADGQLDLLLRELGVEVVAVDREHTTLARDAALRFGRGRHPAALNYGDCFSYAAAAVQGEPLLFVGDDFAKTDIPSVPW